MTDEEIGKALADISELKKSVKSNMNLLRPYLMDRAFIPFSLFGAAAYFGIFFLLHIMIERHGSFAAIPFGLRTTLTAAIVVVLIASSIIKQVMFTRMIAREHRTISFFDLFKDAEFRNFYLMVVAGFCGTVLIGAKFALETGSWWPLMPVAVMYSGLVIGLFAVFFHTAVYMISALVAAAYGTIALFFMRSSEFLWLAIFFAVFFTSFALMIFIGKRHR